MSDLPEPQEAAPEGWEGILDAGERILWQGRPDGGFHIRAGQAGQAGFGLFFAGFAVVWMVLASNAPGPFWMFGLIHFSVGMGLALKPTIWAMMKRRDTWYTLTDRRAIIATDAPFEGRRLMSYPITAATRVDFIDRAQDSVHFAEEVKRSKNGTYRVPIGFDYIGSNGPEVLRLIRDIQAAHQAEKDAAP